MSMNKLTDSTLLGYYDSKAKIREDNKINSLPIRNSMDYVKWYFNTHRDGKIYGVKFQYTSAGVIVPTGIKYGANEGLVAEPSTRTVSGRNDYDYINLFKHFDANVSLDENGNTIIDAIRGDKNFSYTGKVDVVCVFAPVYERVYRGTEDGTNYLYIEWCDTEKEGFTLNALCRDGNGNNKGFYCITKFQAGLIDGVPYASAGLYPWVNPLGDSGNRYPCYNSCVTSYHNRHPYMCAMTMAEWAMIQRIFMMKYANTDSEKIIGGLTQYYYQGYAVTTKQDNKKYATIATSQANNLSPSTFINVGTSGTRGSTTMYNIARDLELVEKKSVVTYRDIVNLITIDNTDYTLSSESFDIVACIPDGTDNNAYDPIGNNISLDFSYNDNVVTVNLKIELDGSDYILNAYDENDALIAHINSGVTTNTALVFDKEISTLTTHYVSTSLAITGYSLDICGSDGCWFTGVHTANMRRYPAVLSGIEFNTGAWDVIGNAVWQYDSNTLRHTLLMNDSSKLTTTTATITSTYTDIGTSSDNATSSNWFYNNDIHYDLDNGGFVMDSKGASSTTGLCDGTYILGNQTSGLYEVLVFGPLGSGAPSGLFCANADHALSYSSWGIASRPSLGGSRV